MCSLQKLENHLHGNLNLPRCCGCRSQRTCHRVGVSSPVKNVSIARGGRRSEVWVIENIEDFRSELNVESFGNALDVIVLEQREVQRGDAGAEQNVAAGIAAQVETCRERNRRADAWWQGIAILVPKCHVGSCGDRKAFGLDVMSGIARIREGLATRSTEPVRKCPIVAAVGICRV